MISRARALPALLLTCLSGCVAEDGGDREVPFLVGGIQVNEPDMESWLDTLGRVGLNTLAVTVYARQGLWDSAELESEAREDWLAPEVREARKRDLEVVLVLRVALEHALEENLFLWHGMIMPRSDDELRRWFEAYGDFVESWARFAEREGIAVLAIGSELNALASTAPVERLPVLEEYYLNAEKQERQHERVLAHEEKIDRSHLKAGWGKTYESVPVFLEEQSAAHRRWAEWMTFGGDLEAINRRRRLLDELWRQLIERARGVYSGRLTYAANFDQYQEVGFWDALDLIGINAYFPLRDELSVPQGREGLLALFETSWTRIMGEIEDFRVARRLDGLPVLFTELGYTFRAEATVNPWAGGGFGVVGDTAEGGDLVVWQERPVDLLERALAVRALRTVHRRHPDLLAGILYWKLSTVPEHRRIEPFVLVLEEEDPSDPLQRELTAFLESESS